MNEFINSIEIEAKQFGTSFSGLFKISLIILGAILLIKITRKGIQLFSENIAEKVSTKDAQSRAETLSRIFKYITTALIYLIAIIMILSELGISITPILGAAGVIGVAVGFGTQSLVKDYFGGFFLLIEDQIRQGDSIKVEGFDGVVEEITLRYVKLRDYEGFLHFIPNSQIRIVTNMSRDFSYAVFDIPLNYVNDLDKVITIMEKVSLKMKEDIAFTRKILSPIEIAGVDKLTDSNYIIKARIKTPISEHTFIKREYLKRLLVAFIKSKIKPPYPHINIHQQKN